MAKVAIKALSVEGFAFTLFHASYCEKIAACSCRITRVLRPVSTPSGAMGQAYTKVVHPQDIVIACGETVELNAHVLKLPAVFEGMRRGLIEVKEATPEKKADAGASEPVSESASDKTQKSRVKTASRE